ncbi:hypothetical protein ACFUGD_33520, partial [Streptomyces sp. NPDC057217]|uniref:hypothetical protein n=1 Tax=Streptomyces sp. NPDC057217 TaxID=3346054 RepID=UPI00363D3E8E
MISSTRRHRRPNGPRSADLKSSGKKERAHRERFMEVVPEHDGKRMSCPSSPGSRREPPAGTSRIVSR